MGMLAWMGHGNEVDLQDGELARFQRQNWEQGKAYNEAGYCGQVAASKDE